MSQNKVCLRQAFEAMREALGHIASHYDDPTYVRKVALTAFLAAEKVCPASAKDARNPRVKERP